VTDIVDRQTRSRMMAGIGPRDTAPEIAVRRFLHSAGLRFRVNDRRLPGAPDLVFPASRSVVLVHGCFWHRHAGCQYATTPSSNAAFWNAKFARNLTRDHEVRERLRRDGWRTFVVWECQAWDETLLDRLYWHLRARKDG
jgi:DNA mismatch endonuclease (patch repair protein)